MKKRKVLIFYFVFVFLLSNIFVSSVNASGKKITTKTKSFSLSLESTKTKTLQAPKKKGYKIKKVSYCLSKKGIVSVKKKGTKLKVTAKKKGFVKINETITYKKGKKQCKVKYVYKVTVSKKDIKVTSIQLNKSELCLTEGENAVITASVTPSNATNLNIVWTSSDTSVVKVSKKDEKKAEITALKEGTTMITAMAGGVRTTCAIEVRGKVIYSYSISPLLPPFNEYFYVRTDNPNPESFYFLDTESIYREEGSTTQCEIRPTVERFIDVEYENKETGRVKGGYICKRQGDSSDGGTLHLMKMADGKSSYVISTDVGPFSFLQIDKGRDTGVTVECVPVKDMYNYLLETYTTADMSFFDKMSAVAGGMDLALYPQEVVEQDITGYIQYPFLCTSIYPEHGLWYHTNEMYKDSTDVFLLEALYPYVLSSYGVPHTIATVARMLAPDCEITAVPNDHCLINISKDGVTETYGGFGSGDHNPLYVDHIEKLYLFDGSADDFATTGTMERMEAKWEEYRQLANKDNEKYEKMLDDALDMIEYSSWIRVGSDHSTWPCYAYLTKGVENHEYSYVISSSPIHDVSNIWVDGRYIDEHEEFIKGAKFQDYPTASIMIQNMEFTDVAGHDRTADVTFEYDEETDTWRADEDYTYGILYDRENYTLPDEMILTREEVDALNVDRNTNENPHDVLIFDGTVYPGTKEE